MEDKERKLIKFLLDNLEGGYANIKGDAGGETYRGIARNFWPKWEGWKLVDSHKPLKSNQVINCQPLEEKVYEFYDINFYRPLNVDGVNNHLLSSHLFCYGVHAGTITAAKLLQKSVNAVTKAGIAEDGKIGSITLGYLNGKSADAITIEYINAISRKYQTSKFAKAFQARLNKISIWAKQS